MIPIPSMALHFRKILSSDSDGEYLPPCHTNSDSDDCVNAPPHAVPHHRIPTPLIAMLCVLALAFLMLSYLALIRYRNTHRRVLHRQHPVSTPMPESVHEEEAVAEVEVEEEVVVREDEDQGLLGDDHDHHVWYIRTVGFPQSVINSIAVFTYKRGEGLIEGTDCSVCLNEFEEEETLRLLPKCSHAFHLPCIDTWLRAHKNCPLCRAPIMAPNNAPAGNTSNVTNQPANTFESSQEAGVERSQEIIGAIGSGPAMSLQEGVTKTRSSSNSSNGDIRVVSDLAEHRGKISRELPRVRRSSSMDILATSNDSEEIGNKEGYLEKRGCKKLGIYGLIKSASFGRSLQKGPISMKRSFSFSGKRKNQQKSKLDLYPRYLDA